MNYRDDRDALRAEVDTLHQELDSARTDQARLANIEQRLAAAKAEMESLEVELGRARGRVAPKNRSVLLPVVITAVAVLAGAGAFLTIGRPAPLPPPPQVVGLPEEPGSPPPRAAEQPSPAAPADPPAPREARATWTATVTRSTDASIRAGSPCQIDATVVPDKTGMHVTAVTVSCAGKALYDQKGALNGTSMLDSDAQQRPGPKAGTWVYELIFSDVGARSATRNQAQLDSTRMLGKVWSDNLPEMRVDLAIKSGSAPLDVAVVDAGK